MFYVRNQLQRKRRIAPRAPKQFATRIRETVHQTRGGKVKKVIENQAPTAFARSTLPSEKAEKMFEDQAPTCVAGAGTSAGGSLRSEQESFPSDTGSIPNLGQGHGQHAILGIVSRLYGINSTLSDDAIARFPG